MPFSEKDVPAFCPDDESPDDAPHRDFDIDVIQRLYADYGFKYSLLSEWFGISRQRVSQKLHRRGELDHWQGKPLLEGERTVLTYMAEKRLYHHATISAQYYILNNKQDDGAVLIVRDDDIKCFFLRELPLDLQEALRREDMLLLSAEEHDAKSSGDVVSVLKKKYIWLHDEGRFRQLAQSRGMTLDEYTLFLFGMPRIVPQGNMLDAQVVEQLEKNLYEGRVRILTSPENVRLRRFAERNGLTVDDLIHLYGYTSINDDDLDSASYLPPRSPELDMRVLPARPEDLAEDIFAREPLLGNRLLSPEEQEEVFSRAKKYVDKLMRFRDYDPPLSEQMWITLAVINYAKDWDTGDNRKFWRYIAAQFAYRDDSGRLMNRLYACIETALTKKHRWFIETRTEKQYKATVVAHAMATKQTWMYFCDFLFDFYKTNLNWTYVENDPIIDQMVDVLRIRLLDLDTSGGDDSGINISSHYYHFQEGIRKLFLFRPEYAGKVSSQLLRRIDAIIKQHASSAASYCDKLCDAWWERTIHDLSKEKRKQTDEEPVMVAVSYARISPVYRLANDRPVILFPDVRLAQTHIDRLEVRLLHGGQTVDTYSLRYYGNELGLTLSSFSVDLESYLRSSGSDHFDPQIQIVCNDETIYDSDTRLYRDQLIFKNEREVDASRCEAGEYFLLIPSGAQCALSHAEAETLRDTLCLRAFYMSLFDGFTIMINGRLVAFDMGAAGPENEFRIVIPSAIQGVSYLENGLRYGVMSRAETIHIIASQAEDSQKYRLLLNDQPVEWHSLACHQAPGGYVFDLPLQEIRDDLVRLCFIDLASEQLVLSQQFRIVQELSCHFDRPFYFDEDDYASACLNVQFGGAPEVQLSFSQADTLLSIPHLSGELEFEVPSVRVDDGRENVWDRSSLYWIDDIPRDRFLYVRQPENCQAFLSLDGRPLPKEGDAYALGNAVLACDRASAPDQLELTMTVTTAGQAGRCYPMGRIAVREQFLCPPKLTVKDGALTWDSGRFIGHANEAFELCVFESNGYERLRCPVMLDEPVVCDNVDLPLGEYRFTISKRSGNIFLPSLIELASGRFFSGDENELRFLGKQIQLCSITIIPSSGEEQSVDIRPSFIDRLKFEGVEYVDSEEQECAIYTGTMYFIGPDGNRHEYSWKEGENRYHTQMYQVNPVRIVYINDSVLGITDLEGDGLYYVRLFDRASMQNIYQLTDHCPPPNSDPNSQRYDVGDLYAYTTIKERMPAYV